MITTCLTNRKCRRADIFDFLPFVFALFPQSAPVNVMDRTAKTAAGLPHSKERRKTAPSHIALWQFRA
jgi:hypothetical protein